jgi:hypothetical protein
VGKVSQIPYGYASCVFESTLSFFLKQERNAFIVVYMTHETRYRAGIVFHAGHYSGWGRRRTYLLEWTEALRMITVMMASTAHFKMRSTRAVQESKAQGGIFWLHTVAFLAPICRLSLELGPIRSISLWLYLSVPMRTQWRQGVPIAEWLKCYMLPIALSVIVD